MNCCDDYGKCTQGDNCPVRENVVKNARPRVPLTDDERKSFDAANPKTPKEWDALFSGIEARI